MRFSSRTTANFLGVLASSLEVIRAVAGWNAGLGPATPYKRTLVLQLLLCSLGFFNVLELVPKVRALLVDPRWSIYTHKIRFIVTHSIGSCTSAIPVVHCVELSSPFLLLT